MSISTIGGTSALNQAYLSQQAQSVLAQSFDPQTTASISATATAGTDPSSNALTGGNASTLDSQTLQALMDLTQQDPAADDSSSAPGQSGQSGQAQGAHHHHHHHGGGMQAQSSDPSTSPTATDTASSTDAFGVAEPDGDSSESPLAAALSQA
jgi:hypothetical protein